VVTNGQPFLFRIERAGRENLDRDISDKAALK